MKKVAVHWFRRDLRLKDNASLFHSLQNGNPVLPVFIFDDEILNELPKDDARVSFIYQQLELIHKKLKETGSGLRTYKGNILKIWTQIIHEYRISDVYFNNDYEPYAIGRDEAVKTLLKENHIQTHSCKDQVIFEKEEIVKDDGNPYTVFTPFMKKWKKVLADHEKMETYPITLEGFLPFDGEFPSLMELGFKPSPIKVPPVKFDSISQYEHTRNIPSMNGTTRLGSHLRFGTLSIRALVKKYFHQTAFINELIWREFFMQILYNYPRVVNQNFRTKFDKIIWRNDQAEFVKWCNGLTGYPLVDAGMRELNATGYMNNRVRMVTAGFLCKHLLIDWRWGEAYFAENLLDYELASNNGNWQWAAGTGCDAAPYFRVFNPVEQQKKFDPHFTYIKRWVPEWGSSKYPSPMVDHKFARQRALEAYSVAK